MRAKWFILPTLMLALAGTFVLAQDGDTKAPFNPYTNAKKGDWAVYAMTMKGQGAGMTGFMQMAVDKVEADTVTIAETDKDAGADAKPTASSKQYPKGPTTAAALFDLKDKKLEDVKFVAEKKTVGGKEFDCQKFSCKVLDKEAPGTMTMWITESVAAGGMVAAEMTVTMPTGEMKISAELLGFGPEGKADWGKTFADVEKK